MIGEQEIIVSNEWIEEPRWSWFGTPLWRVEATKICLRSFVWPPGAGRFVGGLTAHDFRSRIELHWLYFTKEEYVLWKLSNFQDANGFLDIENLRQGIIYS